MKREETFIEKLYECNQHKKRLLDAKNILENIMPLDFEKYQNLEILQISVIDQMIFRFSKLQDSMGEKIFTSLLELSGEDVKKMTFIDKLNRLEELELLYKDEWMELRKDRNEIAHEYSFNQEEVMDGINNIYIKIDKLIQIYDDIYSFCIRKFNFLSDMTN